MAELEYRQAELDVLVETKAQALRERVADTVLELERLERAIALAQKQLTAEQQRLAMARIGYRLGEGSRDGFLAQQLRVEALEARVVELEAEQEQLRRRLGLWCPEG
jgi:outer membrane protein TolC